jgi:hypothetical protein
MASVYSNMYLHLQRILEYTEYIQCNWMYSVYSNIRCKYKYILVFYIDLLFTHTTIGKMHLYLNILSTFCNDHT